MNTAVECPLALIAGPASNRPGIAVMKIAIAIIFPWICALKFVPNEANVTSLAANGLGCHSTSMARSLASAVTQTETSYACWCGTRRQS